MTKKILSLALVVVMLFSFAVTAFAVSQDTIESTVTAAAKTAFLLEGASSDQISTTKITLCYLKDGEWNVTARCDGGYYYECTAGELTGLPSDIECAQESEIVAFFNEIIESIMNFIYGLIY